MSVFRRGIILISHAVTNAFVGYLSKDVGSSGRMIYTTDISKAETIRYMGPSSQYTPVTRGELRRAGAPGNLPFLGLIRGLASTNNNIGPGSANYLHLADTAHTDPGALPAVGPNSETAQSGVSLAIESSVWNIDAYSGSITAQWINSDGSTPTTTLATWGQSLIATGDLAALQAQFPNTYNPVRFQILFSP
ncbi:hypothetical protein FRC17_005956 [Serendipita sp. 399]|nr:hypothetical protein FRC17_005956 [Serendipita sp. 399]